VNEKDDRIYYSPGEYFGKLRILLNSLWKRAREIMKAKDYDLVFVQREALMLGTAYFEKSISHKIPMIFDFDDSIWVQMVSEGNKKPAFLKDASKNRKDHYSIISCSRRQ